MTSDVGARSCAPEESVISHWISFSSSNTDTRPGLNPTIPAECPTPYGVPVVLIFHDSQQTRTLKSIDVDSVNSTTRLFHSLSECRISADNLEEKQPTRRFVGRGLIELRSRELLVSCQMRTDLLGHYEDAVIYLPCLLWTAEIKSQSWLTVTGLHSVWYHP